MAKQIVDLTSIVSSELSVDDLLVVRDVSAQKDKKVRIGDIVGMPTAGWLSAVGTWVYTDCTDDGLLTVGVSGTPKEKYSKEMRVQFVYEDTVKYGLIREVGNNSLKVQILDYKKIESGIIKTPQYSTEFAPATKDSIDFTDPRLAQFIIKEKVPIGVLFATLTRWGNIVMCQIISTAVMPTATQSLGTIFPEGFRPYTPDKKKQTEAVVALSGWNSNKYNAVGSMKVYSNGTVIYVANNGHNEWYGTGIWQTGDPFPES